MSKIKNSEFDDMLPEYDFDYSKAKPNRFAKKTNAKNVTITLEPDVAEFFATSKAVNKILRAIIVSMPKHIPKNIADDTIHK